MGGALAHSYYHTYTHLVVSSSVLDAAVASAAGFTEVCPAGEQDWLERCTFWTYVSGVVVFDLQEWCQRVFSTQNTLLRFVCVSIE